MAAVWGLTIEERQRIEALIAAFEGHGCGLGLDKQAQVALRRLIRALDAAERELAAHRGTGDGG